MRPNRFYFQINTARIHLKPLNRYLLPSSITSGPSSSISALFRYGAGNQARCLASFSTSHHPDNIKYKVSKHWREIVLLCSLANDSKAKWVLTFLVFNEHIHNLIHLNLEGQILGILGLISSYASVWFSNKGLSNVVHSNITAAQRGFWWHDHDTVEQNNL